MALPQLGGAGGGGLGGRRRDDAGWPVHLAAADAAADGCAAHGPEGERVGAAAETRDEAAGCHDTAVRRPAIAGTAVADLDGA